jgi:Holliday junction resolvase RusA-like endonuclease
MARALGEEGRMTLITEFFVAGKPIEKGNFRAFNRGGFAKITNASKETDAWQARVAIAAQNAYRDPPISGPCKVRLTFYHARPKSHYRKGSTSELTPKFSRFIWHTSTPDADKLVRCILDALAPVVMLDDKQATVGEWFDFWVTSDQPTPGVHVEVTQTEAMKLQESME